VVSSETVVAHVRKATAGNLSLINSHPFQFGKWIFAHNGDIPGFAEHREELVSRIPPVMRRFSLGDTDSEVIFYLLLSRMSGRFDLERRGYPVDELTGAIRDTVGEICDIVGLDCYDPENRHFLTFLVTNGDTMAAHNGGKELYLSTHKRRCSQRHNCPSFAPACEQISPSGFVTHLIFCSEPLQGENVWLETRPGQIVGVDWRMRIYNDGPALEDLDEHILQRRTA
jgi:glutamine amidotransferase